MHLMDKEVYVCFVHWVHNHTKNASDVHRRKTEASNRKFTVEKDVGGGCDVITRKIARCKDKVISGCV